MKIRKIADFFVRQIKAITIEPVIFFTVLGWSTIYGSEVTTNLIMWKFCHLKLNYSELICANLSAAENDEVQKEVQILVNNFQMNSQWISSVPLFTFSIIAGALSDVFGRKPLILFPLLGYLIGCLINIINYTFVKTRPVEFFYLNRIGSFFGGYAVYYLGVYSYGATVTKPTERAYRLTRLDGIETLASVAGTLVSPYIFRSLGFYGNYIISATFYSSGIAYLVFFVKEPIVKSNPNHGPQTKNDEVEANPMSRFFQPMLTNMKSFFNQAVVVPLTGMKSVLTRDRKKILKLLIALQLITYGIYIFSINRLNYLYMLLVFDGFTSTDYAFFGIFISLLNAFFLIIVMPIVSGKFKIHDALMLVIIVAFEIVSALIRPFTTTVWQYYLATSLGAIGYCKYAIVRSLMSKSVDPDEVGKMFSVIAVVASLAPIAGSPLFRQLYNYTLHTFPGAYFFLFAAFHLIAACCSIYVYYKRHELNQDGKSQTSPEKANPDKSSPDRTETIKL